MKMIDIVRKLQSEGHIVNYRIRKDGGIIVTQIDGKRFTGNLEGNRRARELTDIRLSQKQQAQRTENVTKFIRGHKKPKSKLDDDLKKELRKAQRIWRKNKTGGTARPTARKVRWRLEHEGRKETERYLRRITKYAEGIAYEENVLYLIGRLERLIMQFPQNSNEITSLIEKIESKIFEFKEKWIAPIYEIIYDIEQYRISIEDGIVTITSIIE